MNESNEPKDPEQEGLIVFPPAPEDPFVINEANRRILNWQARINSNQVEQDYWEEKKQDAIRRLIALLNAVGVPLDVAATIYWWNVTGLLASIPIMIVVTFVTLYNTICPSFYGREAFAVVLAAGASLAIVVGVECLLWCLGNMLIPRYKKLFIGIVTVVMVACLLGALMQFAKARALLMHLPNADTQSVTQSVIQDETSQSQGPETDWEAIKRRIDQFNKWGMNLLACAVDWLFGLFAYRCLKNYLTFKPIMRAFRDRKRAEKKLRYLRRQSAAMST